MLEAGSDSDYKANFEEGGRSCVVWRTSQDNPVTDTLDTDSS